MTRIRRFQTRLASARIEAALRFVARCDLLPTAHSKIETEYIFAQLGLILRQILLDGEPERCVVDPSTENRTITERTGEIWLRSLHL
jgi:hypothetical protein